MFLLGLPLATVMAGDVLSDAKSNVVRIAVITSLQGADAPYGKAFLDGITLAVEEANRDRAGQRVMIESYDDRGTEDGAREVAAKIAASEAHVVAGPLLSTSSLAAGPILAKAGLPSIVSTAASDLITRNETTFRAIFKNSDLGDSLAAYLRYALGGTRALVLVVENGYGRTMADGFKRGAERLGIATSELSFKTPAERDEAARKAAADPDSPAILLAMLDDDAAAAITILRRQGVNAPMLGGTGLVEDTFAALFKDLPEERRNRGFFTKDLYAVIPVMMDSANVETLAFAERFRTRFAPQAPVSWAAVQGYDAGRLAVAAIWRAGSERPGGDTVARREEARKFLAGLDGPGNAVKGVLGPLWFTPTRDRHMPIRVGRFNGGRFESAPLQLVPAAQPSADELASGEIFEVGAGEYARLQQVVYTGVFVNELPRLDLAQGTFTADLYVWMRFSRSAGVTEADPILFEFPDMVRGGFDENRPVAKRDFDDGTTYRLWRVRGDFKNDYDLRRYPYDRQTLRVRLYNAGAVSNRLVYVTDRSVFDPVTAGAVPEARRDDPFGGAAAATAFRNLSQWEPLRVRQGRDNLVTESTLGDPTRVGFARVREWSGFNLQVELKRRIGTTLIKTLLPIGLMTLILFATLYFPSNLAAAKVTVAITAGLSGAVLLSAINAQLGNVGYVIAVEYGFYVFFALCLICIVTVLVGEQRRLAGQSAVLVERIGRYAFMAMSGATLLAALIAM